MLEHAAHKAAAAVYAELSPTKDQKTNKYGKQ